MFIHELGFFAIELLILLNVTLALLVLIQLSRQVLGKRCPDERGAGQRRGPWRIIAVPRRLLTSSPDEADEADEPAASRGERLSRELDAACESIAAEYGLSQRERDVLPYLMRGYKAASIANALHISESTVHMHVRRMWAKLGVGSTEDLLALAEGRPCARRCTPEQQAGRPKSTPAKP